MEWEIGYGLIGSDITFEISLKELLNIARRRVMKILVPAQDCKNCDYFNKLKNALERYIKYAVLRDVSKEALKNCKILLVPICPNEACEKKGEISDSDKKNMIVKNAGLCWMEFEKLLDGNGNGEIKNSNGILFITFYDKLTKDTRAIRMFFENTMCAETANFDNICAKLKKLIVKIGGNTYAGEKSTNIR